MKEYKDLIKHIDERRKSYREMGDTLFQDGISKKDMEIIRLGDKWLGRADALDWLVEWINASDAPQIGKVLASGNGDEKEAV
jgi:hypothetical protein